MKIAVYTPALNEEKYAHRFASSCRDADRVYVLDTGSTDRTVEILSSFKNVTVKSGEVNPFRFDEAHNKALAIVAPSVQVCIRMNPDEILVPGWRQIVEREWKVGVTTRMWYTYEFARTMEYPFNRIHCRRGYTWKHRTHEDIYWRGPGPEQFCHGYDLRIEHFPDPDKAGRKTRDLELLELDWAEDRHSRTAYYLAREYMYASRYTEAAGMFRNFLVMPESTDPAYRSNAWKFLSDIQQKFAALELAGMRVC